LKPGRASDPGFRGYILGLVTGLILVSSLSMASRNLRRRKARTILTVSGIVVGVALIMVLLALTQGTSTQTNGLIRDILPAQITVVNSTAPTGNGAGIRALFGSEYSLNQTTVTEIGRLGGVYAATGQLSTSGYINGAAVLLAGVDPGSYDNATNGLSIQSGTSVTTEGGDQVVVSQTLATQLGLSLGSVVTIGPNSTGGASYTVVGTYASATTFLDRSAYISLSNAQALAGEQGKVSEIYVKVDTQDNVSTIVTEIQDKVAGVRVVTSTNIATAVSSLTGTLTTVFAVIGFVALLAGGFGVVNTMIMSVSERTREIGTLKAIGARSSQILKIFIGEAFLIGVIGGAVGVAIGVAASLLLSSLSGGGGAGGLGRGARVLAGALAPAITPELILLSLFLGGGVGVVAGLYPAWRASRMDPAEALRHV
jgi:putative ABC transport system permease protein